MAHHLKLSESIIAHVDSKFASVVQRQLATGEGNLKFKMKCYIFPFGEGCFFKI